MFHTILIANRGEIACRILETTRRMGIKSIIVYSHADRFSRAVLRADQAIYIGDSPAETSYLNIPAIILAALSSGAQAVHPGYGFLSENPALAHACAAADLVFIGPSINALTIMGSKQRAKQHLKPYNIPMIPGYHDQDQSDETLFNAAASIGFPLMLKAAAGGGGKGMRVVHSADEWPEALQATRREASAYFADSTLLIEKQLTHARHLEVQIMADNYGNVVHIFERECSVQRRHQKLIEEAPAPNISNTSRDRLTSAAITVATSIQYTGAGTVEFMVDSDEQIYFMEMNTRLQVEHPTTEMITKLDLVEWQLRIAAQEPLPCTQEKIHQSGHAIECRLYAEDPQHAFLPSMGTIHTLVESEQHEYLRLDSGITSGDTVTPYYDAMLGKLIAWGETRTLALSRLRKALTQYHLVGLKTNRDYLSWILNQPEFISGNYCTDFLNTTKMPSVTENPNIAVYMAACLDYIRLNNHPDALRAHTIGFQLHTRSTWCNHYLIDKILYKIKTTPINSSTVELQLDNDSDLPGIWSLHHHDNHLVINNGQRTLQAWTMKLEQDWIIDTGTCVFNARKAHSQAADLALKHGGTEVFSPMPGTVVAILHVAGEHVQQGEPLMVLEAMKMEHTLHAPCDGQIESVFYALGAQVQESVELIRLKEDTNAD